MWTSAMREAGATHVLGTRASRVLSLSYANQKLQCLETYKERKLYKLQLSHQSTVLSLCYLIFTNEYIHAYIDSKF